MDFLTLPKFKQYRGQPIRFVQRKLDGHYYEVYRSCSIDEPDHLFVCSKKQNVNVWPKLRSHTVIARRLLALPMETIIQGEMFAPGVQATSVPTLINEADSHLQFGPFALPLAGGLRIASDRHYNDVTGLLRGLGFEPPEWRFYTGDPWSPAVSLTEKEQALLLQEAVGSRSEGWVCKESHLGAWYKLKPTKTVDCVVTGTEISDSITWFGGLKCMKVAVYDGGRLRDLASVGTGFDGDWRMSVDVDSLVGRVVEVEYDSLAANSRLKFPRFVRFRDDEKEAAQCTADQL